MDKLQQWKSITENVQGFFMPEAAAVWDVLLESHNQAKTYATGNVVEIGVLRGKSAALAALHTRADEELILCDLYLSDEVKHLIASIKSEKVTYLEGNSANLVGSSKALEYAKRCRWIHIDGDHTGQSVTHDLMLADQWLSEKGIICCDDFMNPVYPQLTAAIFHYLNNHPYELTMFLCGYNKCYLTRPKSSHLYLEMILNQLYKELSIRGVQNFSVYKTTLPSDMNCFGVSHRFSDHDYYGLDDDPTLVVI